MARIAVCGALLLWSICASAQEAATPPHQHTAPPPNARFEILQSELAARWTFRLDRYTGRVWQLVKTRDNDSSWEEMVVRELPPQAAGGRAKFQLFSSGLAVRHTFLIDTDTGRTWVVVSGKGKNKDGTEYDYSSWQLFAE